MVDGCLPAHIAPVLPAHAGRGLGRSVGMTGMLDAILICRKTDLQLTQEALEVVVLDRRRS